MRRVTPENKVNSGEEPYSSTRVHSSSARAAVSRPAPLSRSRLSRARDDFFALADVMATMFLRTCNEVGPSFRNGHCFRIVYIVRTTSGPHRSRTYRCTETHTHTGHPHASEYPHVGYLRVHVAHLTRNAVCGEMVCAKPLVVPKIFCATDRRCLGD